MTSTFKEMNSKKCKICDKNFYPASILDSNDIALIKTALTFLSGNNKLTETRRAEFREALANLFQDLEWYPKDLLHVACGACKEYPENKGIKFDSTKGKSYDDLWRKIGVVFGHFPNSFQRFS